jgi:phosphatidylserine/phosphatidylglycerophosphate/cardiolipin synthase-like enzyme
MPGAIHRLSIANLRALAASLRSGPLSLGLSKLSLMHIAGSSTEDVRAYLERLREGGMSPNQIAFVIDVIAETQSAFIEPEQTIDLILSDPELPGIPLSDTIATVRTLVAEATQELVLVGYAVHNAKPLFELIASRMSDIPRKNRDTSLESEIVRRFATEFRKKHWPWPNLPQLYYDPRSLSQDLPQRTSLHAKCVIADRARTIITAANFTEAAWLRNLEVGVLVQYEPLVSRLSAYIEGLISIGFFSICDTVVYYFQIPSFR